MDLEVFQTLLQILNVLNQKVLGTAKDLIIFGVSPRIKAHGKVQALVK